jgi:hypothetical protein
MDSAVRTRCRQGAIKGSAASGGTAKGSAERFPVSFASEPGRDDGSLPPVDIEIPDDARELARDVLAYHRERRARRRRERWARVLRPVARAGLIRHGTIFPVVATCVAMSLVVAATLSVMIVSPASAPVTDATPPAASSLPKDTVKLGDTLVAASRLTGSVLVLVPVSCRCGQVLSGIATQAASAHVDVYFVYPAGGSAEMAWSASVTAEYGDNTAHSAYDVGELFFLDYAPTGPVALLVARDGTIEARRAFPPGFDLTPALRSLKGTH